MPLIKFGWLDLIYVTLLIRICYIGFKNGFFPEIFKGIGLWLAFILSFNNYTIISGFLANKTGWSKIGLELVSFSAIFFTTLLVFKILSTISFLLINKENVSFLNRAAGLILAGMRGLLFLSLLHFILLHCPLGYLSKSAEEMSLIGRRVAGIAPKIYILSMRAYPYKKVDTPLVGLLES